MRFKRGVGIGTVLAAVLATSSVVVDAQPAAGKPPKGQQRVDLSAVRAHYRVYRDPDDNIYAVFVPERSDQTAPWGVFVGDGKVMHAQAWGPGEAKYELMYSFGRTHPDGTHFEPIATSPQLWAPRAKLGRAFLEWAPDKVELRCDGETNVRLTPVPDSEAAAVMNGGRFLTPLHRRRVSFAARDDEGRYFIVDQEADKRATRVFTGFAGKLKQVPLKRVVSDTAGIIYSTSRGELRLSAKSDGTAEWRQGRKRLPLVVLPIDENSKVIYRDLGLYGFLGTVCEDL